MPNADGQGYRDQLIPGFVPPGMGGGGGLRQRHAAAAAQPTEDAINQLMALGFDRDQVVRALVSSNNNVAAAANRLLNNN